MKIEKRGDKYRIQPYVNGKRHSITFDHKPSQREINEILEELDTTISGESTFEAAARAMINDKSNVLSPSTIRGYHTIMRGLSERFKQITIILMSSNEIQREINHLSTQKSSKTVSNYYAFISSVLAYYRPFTRFSVKLPPKQLRVDYVPNTEDIKILLHDCLNNGFGEKYTFPIMLGCYGMRLGEITALTDKDIDTSTCMIVINKSKVLNNDNEYVIKPAAKTDKSNRIIQVSGQCIEAYERYGLYTGYPKSINSYMAKREALLGLEHFSFHKLRHYFASLSIDQGIPLPTIQEFGGWSSPRTLQRIYQHNMRDYSEVSNVISSSLDAAII